MEIPRLVGLLHGLQACLCRGERERVNAAMLILCLSRGRNRFAFDNGGVISAEGLQFYRHFLDDALQLLVFNEAFCEERLQLRPVYLWHYRGESSDICRVIVKKGIVECEISTALRRHRYIAEHEMLIRMTLFNRAASAEGGAENARFC